MALTVTGKAILHATTSKTLTDGSTQTDPLSEAQSRNVYVPSDATILYHNKFTITAAGNQQFDLSGTLKDALGQNAIYTKVYGLLVSNLDTTVGDFIWVGGGGTNFETWLGATGDKIKVGPKGVLYLMSPVDGYVVTATSADILEISAPGANNIDIYVAILGK